MCTWPLGGLSSLPRVEEGTRPQFGTSSRAFQSCFFTQSLKVEMTREKKKWNTSLKPIISILNISTNWIEKLWQVQKTQIDSYHLSMQRMNTSQYTYLMPITTRPVWHHIIMVLGYQPGSKGAIFLPRATFN